MEIKMRREFKIGWAIFVLSLILKQFFDVPEIVMGILLGLGISLLIIGSLYEETHQKLRSWKKSFIK
ncbi:MAG: hypothetical protein GX962_06180 [Epulopiscium sp.]|nr:hypothetical protein [Candidatus Epulonipiscium sp.]